MKELLNGSRRICYNTVMKDIDLRPYLNRFITVTLDDGKEESGFISNPEDFKDGTNADGILVLLNGLLNSEVRVSRITAVRESVREDTVKIPIVGFDKPIHVEAQDDLPFDAAEILKEDADESAAIRELLKSEEDSVPGTVDARIDELFEQSLADTMDVAIDTLIPDQEDGSAE